MPRRIYTWKLRNRELALGDRTLIMGVLNVTPDSFSDGGKYLDPDLAFARAMQMEEQGADIIDIGGESTKPGAQPVTAEEELRRIVPVLKRLREKLSIPISVDTYKAETAERALELGAEIVNDPSGFTFDPQLVKPVVQFNAGVIFNHMRGRPETWASLGPLTDVMGAIVKDLDASVNRARRAGLDRSRMLVDPGIGFGKRREQNSEIISRLGEMTKLELPVLIGPARKSFLAQTGERETQFATASAVAASIMAGAHIVRVHDVEEMKIVAGVADDILRCFQRRADEAQEATQVQTPRRSRTIAMGGNGPATNFGPHPPVRPPVTREPSPEVAEQRPQAAAAHAADEAAPLHEKNERGPIEHRDAPHRDNRPREDHPRSERPRTERSGEDRPRIGRPRDDRPRDDRPRDDRPRDDRPRTGRPDGDRPRFAENRPRFNRDKPRPQGDRPSYSRERPAAGERTSRPYGDRPRPGGDRPFRPSGDRPRPGGDRPFRPSGDRPRPGGDRPFRPSGDRPRPGGDRPFRPSGDRPRPGGDRPFRPSGDRPRPSGDRPFRPSGDRPRPSGDRPFRPSGDRPRPGGDRPPRPDGDRPRPSGGDRPRTGAPRPWQDRGRRSGPPRGFRPKPRGKG